MKFALARSPSPFAGKRCYRSRNAVMIEGLEQRTLLTTYFVDVAASGGGDGTPRLPFNTIQAAANIVNAGDIVNVRPGTYTEQVRLTRSGTNEAPILFQAPDGEVTVTSPSVTMWNAVISIRASHIKFDGIDVRDSGWYGYSATGSPSARITNVTVSNAHTLRTYASGIYASHASEIFILNNKVQDACISPNATDNTQECITVAEVEGFDIAGNEVWNSISANGPSNGGEGIDAKGSSINGQIRDNYVHHLSRLGIYLDTGSKQGSGSVDERPMRNIVVTRNIVHDCAGGVILSSELGGTGQDISITNNLIHDNRENGISVTDWLANGPRYGVLIANNTVTRNGFGNTNSNWGGGIDVATTNYTNIRIINNVVSDNESWQIARTRSGTVPAGQITASGNVSFGRALSYWNPIIGSPGLNQDPKFVSPATNDFSLRPDSPAINFGTAGEAPTIDLLGKTRFGLPDAGAYEYLGPSPQLTQVVSRKVHGSSGTFDLLLSIGGVNRTIEPRKNGANRLVFTFSEPVKAADNSISSNEFSIVNATFSSVQISQNTLTLILTGVVDQKYASVTLKGLVDQTGNALIGVSTVAVGNLFGDVNQSGRVTVSDQQAVKNRLLTPVGATNFLYDVNMTGGVIGVSDQQIVKNNLLHQLG